MSLIPQCLYAMSGTDLMCGTTRPELALHKSMVPVVEGVGWEV